MSCIDKFGFVAVISANFYKVEANISVSLYNQIFNSRAAVFDI